MKIDRPNQVWCADITFVPVRNGFPYLVVCDFHLNESNFVRDRHRAQIEASGFRF
jgi:transposase InsO family protein